MHTPIARVRGVVEPWCCNACAIDAPSRCTISRAARRTAAKYRELYDEDLREAVADETSGHYGEL